ncbi:MAG TPA: ASCH domain-containing protein [Blastocatellia bacterium]|nr:ASCH domain-containing protein [Blastocatellia bacterium]
MMKWHSFFAFDLIPAVQENNFWRNYLDCLLSDNAAPYSLHLAVFVEPFLQYVLDGSKKIESRFSSVRCAPYQSVRKDDVILLKRAGGPVVGICRVANAWFYELEPGSLDAIKQQYADALCAQDPSFWEDRKKALFATLMRIQNVQAIQPLVIEKRDRRGWVVLQSASEQLKLPPG